MRIYRAFNGGRRGVDILLRHIISEKNINSLNVGL